MIWGKIRNDGTVQQKLDFGSGVAVKKVIKHNNILGRGYVPVHAADETMQGPSGGGERNANAHRQPVVRHKEGPFNSRYSRESITDVRTRNTNVTVSRTGINININNLCECRLINITTKEKQKKKKQE